MTFLKHPIAGLVLAGCGLLSAGGALAASDALVYCTVASPESFNPQLSSSGPTFIATSQVLYNRLVTLRESDKTPAPSLATEWSVSPDGKTYTFTLRQGVKFNSNKYFTPTRDFNAEDVVFTVMRQKDPANPYHKVSGGNYEYFTDMGLDKLITKVEAVDEHHVRFTLSQPNAAFVADWAMDFASILSAEYADAMLKKGTPEYVDNWPIGTGPFALQQYKQDSLIRYIANPHYWQGEVASKHLIFSITPDPQTRLAKLKTNECQIIPAPLPEQRRTTRKGTAAPAYPPSAAARYAAGSPPAAPGSSSDGAVPASHRTGPPAFCWGNGRRPRVDQTPPDTDRPFSPDAPAPDKPAAPVRPNGH